MIKKVASLVMLLAGVLTCRAHDSHSTVNSEGWSTTRSAASRSENSSYPDVATDQSVVVNWLLICKDLCGAGFGGPTCGKYCISSPSSANNEKYKSAHLCPVLCDFDLGGKNCDCKQKPSKLSKNAIEFCNAMCQHSNRSINGCSKCLSESRESDYTTLVPVPSEMVSHSNRTGSPTTSSKLPKMVDQESVITQRPPTVTSSITAISITSTTPDWSALCIDLCKKGEGGALCNCDLPPLSRMSN